MKWEYMIDMNTFKHLDLDRVNKQGAEGWELCAVISTGEGTQFVYKRPMPQHP